VAARRQIGLMKRVFLTGASSGIGLAIAQALVARGHEVWGTSRDLSHIPAIPHLHPVQLDLRNSRMVEQSFTRAWAESGGLDVVINNAGSGHFGPAENLTTEAVMDEFQVLVFAQLQLTQLAMRQMRTRDTGMIINVTSLASRLPVPFMAAYNSAKAAMASLTMSIQLELPDARVRIVDLQPADIQTQFNDSVMKTDPAYYEDKVAKTWKAVERNMSAAPKPQLVAHRVLGLIEETNPPPRLTIGGFFQAKLAPLIFRFLPQRVRIWGLRKYYGI
jgi:NAD(P)-dependent dehydrogenase (short-subunit alcohol dehydrogenase family)